MDKEIILSLLQEQKKQGREISVLVTKVDNISKSVSAIEDKREEASTAHAKRFDRIERKLYYTLGALGVAGAMAIIILRLIWKL